MAITYPFISELLKRQIEPHWRVLEIGCGAMQYRAGLDCKYEGLDLPDSPYIEERPHWLGSAEAIPCEDNTFDLVFGVGTFHLMNTPSKAFKECARVLRPGGKIIVFDYQRHVLERLRDAYTNTSHVWDGKELSLLLREAGFQGKSVRDHSGYGVNILPWRWANVWMNSILSAAGFRDNWLILEAEK